MGPKKTTTKSNVTAKENVAGGSIVTESLTRFNVTTETNTFKTPSKSEPSLDALVDVSQHSFAIVTVPPDSLQITEMTSGMAADACFPVIMQAQNHQGIHTLLCHADSTTNLQQVEAIFRGHVGNVPINKFVGLGVGNEIHCKFDLEGNTTERDDFSKISQQEFEALDYSTFPKSLDGQCIAIDCSKMHNNADEFAKFSKVNRNIQIAKDHGRTQIYTPVIETNQASDIQEGQIIESRVQNQSTHLLPDGQRHVVIYEGIKPIAEYDLHASQTLRVSKSGNLEPSKEAASERAPITNPIHTTDPAHGLSVLKEAKARASTQIKSPITNPIHTTDPAHGLSALKETISSGKDEDLQTDIPDPLSKIKSQLIEEDKLALSSISSTSDINAEEPKQATTINNKPQNQCCTIQ